VFLTCSKALPAANIAKLEAKGTSPIVLNPAATHIIFASAMPQLMWRFGYAFLKISVFVAAERSASNTTSLSAPSPANSLSALP